MTTKPVAVVTGSGKRRVGWHIATALAERGYRLAIHYRSSAAEAQATVQQLTSLGTTAHAFAADLSAEPAVRQMVADVLAQFGRVDVLVNTAAIWNRKKLEDTTAADVRAHFDTNVLGTFLLCQHLGLAMTRQETGGCIINFGDWADARPYLDYAAYFPSKAAIPGLTRCFAVELGRRNPKVRVNAILPGPIMLPLDLPAEERAEAINATLVQSEGSPQHAVQAALSLIDNPFITGVCLPVDGGRTIFAPAV
jgi:pteridine reductase